MDEVARRRADKANDCRLWSPADALEDVLERVRSGELKPKQLVIHYLEDSGEGDGSTLHGFCVAGITFAEHIALLHIGMGRVMKAWVK